ncbi:MAG: methylhydantoinase [Nitrosopumilaceae archaeon]|nr:methylhydantoinase [Nitrosopumilaceae archaeon]
MGGTDYTAGARCSEKRIRVGIDVGGTFTKAVAMDVTTGKMVAKSTVPTTHNSEKGVSAGIVAALGNILAESGIKLHEIEAISHSTTQAINALLEADVHKVGIVSMGVGPTKKDVVKRTRLDNEKTGPGKSLRTCHTFLDTSHLITKEEVGEAVKMLRGEGAEAIVATEAFGVDDPSNELFVMNEAAKMGVPSTASHEISGIYGLEIRTLTSVINASVLPKTLQVANFVEEGIRRMGVASPLMVMKGDGGVTSMDTFRTKPILTILSGPAASVAGALLHLRITNGIFIEVGGTSTNICVIREGKPEFRYVMIRDHPTCIRSMDVRIVGVAGGSMVRLSRGRISAVGPRSAHIAGLTYSCFADPKDLETGQIVTVRPKDGDEEYACIRCDGNTYAITNTCAANALEMIDDGDYSLANAKSAKISMKKIGEEMGVSYFEAAQSIIQTSSFDIMKTVARILKDYKMDSATEIIGGGGGASVLAPFVAKQMGAPYRKAEQAEVISSVGVALSMLQEEQEVSMVDPTPEMISREHNRVRAALVDKGAIPESVAIDSKFIPDKAILRITAVGNVEMDGGAARNVFTQDEAMGRAAEIMGADTDTVKLIFKSGHYFVFGANVKEKRLLGKKEKQRVVALDMFGRPKISIRNGKVFCGDRKTVTGSLDLFFDSKHFGIMPGVHLVNSIKAMDFSGLTSRSHVMAAVSGELADGEDGMVVVDMS